VSDWKIEKGMFTLRVVVPANTTATVCVPASKLNDVREGRGPAMKAVGVAAFSQTGSSAFFEVGAGEYEFKTPATPNAGS